jgi:hypothetical protein
LGSGYLRTPLGIGKTPLAQAQAQAALLDALEIEKLVVMGRNEPGY